MLQPGLASASASARADPPCASTRCRRREPASSVCMFLTGASAPVPCAHFSRPFLKIGRNVGAMRSSLRFSEVAGRKVGMFRYPAVGRTSAAEGRPAGLYPRLEFYRTVAFVVTRRRRLWSESGTPRALSRSARARPAPQEVRAAPLADERRFAARSPSLRS